jgi:DNA-binding response OmpR family regulator
MTAVQPTVVIIEADEATRHLYERTLRAEYAVFAPTADVTWADVADQRALGVVVIEPGPIDGAGWDLIRELRGRPATQAIPIILCTAQDDRGRDQALGVTTHLVKPVLPADLLAVIQGVLANARS